MNVVDSIGDDEESYRNGSSSSLVGFLVLLSINAGLGGGGYKQGEEKRRDKFSRGGNVLVPHDSILVVTIKKRITIFLKIK